MAAFPVLSALPTPPSTESAWTLRMLDQLTWGPEQWCLRPQDPAYGKAGA
jgi:hypothetical protein